MDVYRGEDPLSEAELLGQLNAIVQMASMDEAYPAVGAFTTSDRRIWGKIYRKLKKGTKLILYLRERLHWMFRRFLHFFIDSFLL